MSESFEEAARISPSFRKWVAAGCGVILVGAWFLIPRYDCEKEMKEFKWKVYDAQVVTKYRAKDRGGPVLKLVDKKGNQVILAETELEDLWRNADSGDYVLKAINSMEFRLKKPSRILSFYPKCNGKQIKN